MLIVDPPTLVDWAYTALKPFMDPVTVRKNVLIKPKQVVDAVHAVAASPAQAEWLIAAMTLEPVPGNLPPTLPPGTPIPVHRTVAPLSPALSSSSVPLHTGDAVASPSAARSPTLSPLSSSSATSPTAVPASGDRR